MMPQTRSNTDRALDEQNALASWRIGLHIENEGLADSDSMLLNVAEWLRLAYNVEKVDIAPDRFDESVLYCGSAWDYVLKKSNSLTDCATLLARFLFAWGAFESVAHSACLGIQKPSESVVESTKSYLCNNVSTFSSEKETIGQFYSEIDKVE